MNTLKKFFMILIIVAFSKSSAFAQAANTLEGDFKTGPAIILILMLCLFLAVGFMNKAKDTATYWAAGRRSSVDVRSGSRHLRARISAQHG